MPNFADAEIPIGAVDEVNTDYILVHAPNPPGSLIVNSDSSLLAPGDDLGTPGIGFTLSGVNLTLKYPPAQSIFVWYRY